MLPKASIPIPTRLGFFKEKFLARPAKPVAA
jgi:hypothetical protein